MARNFNGTTSYGQNDPATGLPTAFPITMACFMKSDTEASGVAFSIGNDAVSNQDYLIIGASWSSPNLTYYARKADNTSGQGGTLGTTDITAGTTHHVCGVYRGTTDTEVYLDGVSDDTSAFSAVAPSAPVNIGVGMLSQAGTPGNFFDGTVAEAGIWNVELTLPEIKALAAGVAPSMIRPTALKGYFPLWGNHSTEPDISSLGNSLTLTGSPTKDNHVQVGRNVPPPKFTHGGALSLGSITGSATQSGSLAVTKGRVVYLYNRDTGKLEQSTTVGADGLYTFNNVPNVRAQEYYTVILDD